MAVLQKIRNHGVLLVAIIAVALFLFVIGDPLRGGEGLVNQSRLNVGEVNGEAISIEEYQSAFEDFQLYQEITQQKSAFTEEENNSVKDMAWQSLVQNRLIEAECAKLGLVVTNEEVRTVIQSGMNQLLQVPYFMNQQGRYDYSVVNDFLTAYERMKESGQQMPELYEDVHKYLLFAQRQIRHQLLAQKYQMLLAQCYRANAVSAQANYRDRTSETQAIVVAVPISTVGEGVVEISDKDIDARYKADKERFRQWVETRDIRLIDVTVVPSDSDKRAMEKEMISAYAELSTTAEAAEAGNLSRQRLSLLPYSPVMKTKDAFPSMIGVLLEGDSTSLEVGQTSLPAYDAQTNSYYTVKLFGKGTVADSVLYRQIGVTAQGEGEADARADSIIEALEGGADFKQLARLYNQTGDSVWIASAHFQQASLDAENARFINAIYDSPTGEAKKLQFANGNCVVLQVLDKRCPVEKYDVCAIVKALEFSDDTYSDEYNRLSSWIAANPSMAQMEANAAQAGYVVRPLTAIPAAVHNIAGIRGTRDAVKWLFDEAKEGDVSQLYECGDNNHLLIIALTGINKQGYQTLNAVKESIRQQLILEKKGEELLERCASASSIAEALAIDGAVADTVSRITFAEPAFVRSTTSSEPNVSAVASRTPEGQFAPAFKGNNGVFMLQVIGKTDKPEGFDFDSERELVAQTSLRTNIQSAINDLYLNANVKDRRYKFF